MMRKFHRERSAGQVPGFSGGTLFFKIRINKGLIYINVRVLLTLHGKTVTLTMVYIELNGGARHDVSRRCRDAMGR